MFRPNLRQTIVIGIAIFTLAFGGIALLSLVQHQPAAAGSDPGGAGG